MADDKIKNVQQETISDHKYILQKVDFEYQLPDGSWDKQSREVYDAGNAVTVLLYNTAQKTVLLMKQFRIASYLNGNSSGMLVETCAGKLEENEKPEEAVIREVLEETGYQLESVEKVFEAYASPGAYTELIHFFIGAYDRSQKASEGGGKEDEQEHIELIEMPFDEARLQLENGVIKDAKTIMLLQYAQLNGLLS